MVIASPILPDPSHLGKGPRMDTRQQRGLQIASTCVIVPKDGYWVVPSQSGQGRYKVRIDPAPATCECKDFETRGKPCKHIAAVLAVVEQGDSVPPRPHVSVPGPKRPTYKQAWPQYNAAQINEKAKFLDLLHDLCRGIPEPAPGKKGGRPPVSMADRVFACCLKVYTTVSGRRASTDMRDARDKGHLGHAPHYSAVARFLEDPEMTPLLKALIVETSKP